MDKDALHAYCSSKKGSQSDFKAEWNARRYMVGGKMFAMFGGDKHGTPLISLKCDPLEAEFYRAQYPGVVIPGYYLNKAHWNSVYLDGDVPQTEMERMIDMAYSLILNGLTKKERERVLSL